MSLEKVLEKPSVETTDENIVDKGDKPTDKPTIEKRDEIIEITPMTVKPSRKCSKLRRKSYGEY